MDETKVKEATNKEPELTEQEQYRKDRQKRRETFLKVWEPHPERHKFGRKVGRNEICPCDKGQRFNIKFKKCCGDPITVTSMFGEAI